MHTINLVIHISAGTLALGLGLFSICSVKGSALHRRFGRYFLYLLSVVVVTGFLGLLFFRTNPFLLMLTVLAGYVGYAGWRNIKLKETRSKPHDVFIAATCLCAGVSYAVYLSKQSAGGWLPSVVFSTLTALAVVTIYDLLKYFFFHQRLKSFWVYEHIYKSLSAFSAIFSAFTGTLLPGFKPYSQIGPSTLVLWLIGFYVVREIRQRKRTRDAKTAQPNLPSGSRPHVA
jgi:uncharacterized membrane protein